MSEQYLSHFAVIIFPLLIVQVWSFRRPFYTLPSRSAFMAIYGAGAAIWSQHYPIHGFGISASYASIPIIISFLYGTRWAGFISAILFALWTLCTHPTSVYAVVISIVLYSILPFILARRFVEFSRTTRLMTTIVISLWTIVMQGSTWVIGALVTDPALLAHRGIVIHKILVALIPFLGIAFVMQAILTMIAVLLMDNIIEDGRLRLKMADNDRRYQAIIEFNPLGICIFDGDNCFVHANEAYQKMTGYGLSDLIGQSRFDLWFPEDVEFASQISGTMQTGEVLVDVPATLRHRNGSRIEIRFSSVPIFTNGVVTGNFGIVNDVTESLRMEKHLRETEKMSVIGQLAAAIAHEIRNPLTALSGFLTLMGEQAAGIDRQASATANTSYLEIMKDEINRINHIAGQLLILGKPQLDYFEEQDLSVVVSEVMSLLEAQLNMSSIVHDVQLPETEVLIWGNRNQIKQALINVVKNAIEAAGNGGSVVISIEQEYAALSSHAKIIIRDTGPGISPGLLEHLGEPFYTTKTEGTGLGLVVTKRIIQSHKGTIEFHSSPGQGTEVELVFPLFVK